MPAQTPLEVEIQSLNREIERLESELSLLADVSKKRSLAARKAAWSKRYLRLARLLRMPAETWSWWPLAVLLLAPVLMGIVLFILAIGLSGNTSAALLLFVVAVPACAALIASLLYRPADARLPEAIADAETKARIATVHWEETCERRSEIQRDLARLVEERRSRMATGRVQRAALLQRPWKTLSSTEWQDFVVEACRTLGAGAERRGQSAKGGELVIDLAGRRIAALVAAADEPNDSDSVHQALALMRREQCESCAIISNGRFTGAAQDFAARNNCRLIGRDDFPEFVLGRVSL